MTAAEDFRHDSARIRQVAGLCRLAQHEAVPGRMLGRRTAGRSIGIRWPLLPAQKVEESH
jgi:hypothetical protein